MARDEQPRRPLARWLRRLGDFAASLETRVTPWVVLTGIIVLLFAIMMLVDGLGIEDPRDGR